jgi:hypothetical protein
LAEPALVLPVQPLHFPSLYLRLELQRVWLLPEQASEALQGVLWQAADELAVPLQLEFRLLEQAQLLQPAYLQTLLPSVSK